MLSIELARIVESERRRRLEMRLQERGLSGPSRPRRIAAWLTPEPIEDAARGAGQPGARSRIRLAADRP
jgi:hypothetical protein